MKGYAVLMKDLDFELPLTTLTLVVAMFTTFPVAFFVNTSPTPVGKP